MFKLTKHIIWYFKLQFYCVILFMLLYYIANVIGVKYKFISTRTHKPVKSITLFECLHFSLITQTTVGYHGSNVPGTPETKLSLLINTIHLFIVLIAISLAFTG